MDRMRNEGIGVRCGLEYKVYKKVDQLVIRWFIRENDREDE